MTDSLHKEKVIPDVIDDFKPQLELHVSYDHGEVKDGHEFSVSDVKHQPKVSFNGDAHSFYTLANVDPDAPSRKDPKFGQWRHWIVMNIPGGDVAKGDVVSSYVGAGPPKGTGLHRYVFLVYKQQGKVQVPKLNDEGMGRSKFSIKDFAKEHHLGEPLGATFYQAQNK